MKRFLSAILVAVTSVVIQFAPAYAVNTDFVSTWNTENLTGVESTDNTADDSSPTKTITLPLFSNGTYNFTVNWGDDSTEQITSSTATHTYATGGIYTVTISGQIEGFGFSGVGDRSKLLNVSNWGSLKLIDAPSGGYFQGANNFTASATDAPDTSSLTTMQSAFHGASRFNGAIGNWDVSHVTHMGSTFEAAVLFNKDISTWNVSNVEIFRATFYEANSFNQDITGWNVSKAWHFGIMFLGADSFDQNLGSWDIASGGVAADHITSLDGMFSSSGLSSTNYGNILNGWAIVASNVTMRLNDAGNNAPNQFDSVAAYPASATAARQYLVDSGWVINDAGLYTVPRWQIGRPNGSRAPVAVGTSASISVRYTNTSDSDFAVDNISIAGNSQYQFSIFENGCNLTLAAGEGCDFTLVFTPRFEGDHLINLRMYRAGDPYTTFQDSGDLSFLATGSCETDGFAGGTGTALDPYLISTVAQYGCMNAFTSEAGFYNFNKSFKLVNDIDFGESPENFVFIGSWWNGFDGDFDGDGYSITGAVMYGTFAGMFPWVTGNANIKNFTVVSPVLDSDWYGGVVTSYVDTAATFSNIHVTNATVRSGFTNDIGGLVGYSGGLTMSNSSFTGTIATSAGEPSDKYVGAIIGYADGPSTLTGVSADAQITHLDNSIGAKAFVGGLIGYANNITISTSAFNGSVSSDSTNVNSSIGGFVASATGGSYSNNSATATISGSETPAAIGLVATEPTLSENTWNVTAASVGGETPSPSPSPSNSPSASPSPSATPTPSETPSATPSPSPSASQNQTPVVTPLPTPSQSPTVTPGPIAEQETPKTPVEKAKQLFAEAPEQLSADDVRELSASYLKNVPVSKFAALQPEALAALDVSQAKLLLAKQVKALTAEQLASLSLKAIAALRPSALAAIDPAKLKGLSAEQKAAITKKQLKALKPAAKKAVGRKA